MEFPIPLAMEITLIISKNNSIAKKFKIYRHLKALLKA